MGDNSVGMLDLKTLNVQVPVTALTFVEFDSPPQNIGGKSLGNSFLLSGSGSFVSTFDLTSCDLLSTVNVLGSRNIHGFAVKTIGGNSAKVCCFGERFAAMFDLVEEIFYNKCVSKTPWSFHDQVLDVRWLSSLENTVAVLLAHNEFHLIAADSGKTCRVVRCEQNSVLFSGIIVDAPCMTFVVAGACLGHLYVWQPLVANDSENTVAVMPTKPADLHLNLGNAGGVFCAVVKDDWQSLAIACEDRGIYTFNLNFSSKSIDQKQTLFGHAARIWKVCWTESNLVSAGEDSQVLFWNVDAGSVIHRFSSTTNTNFFALCVDPRDVHRIAAGLSDGSVRLYNTKTLAAHYNTELPGDDPAVAISHASEHIVCLRFIDAETLICVYNSGQLSLIHLEPSGTTRRTVLAADPHYNIAVVLAVRRNENGRILVGLAHGVPSVITIFELFSEKEEEENKTKSSCDWKLLKLSEFPSPASGMPRAYLFSWLSTAGNIGLATSTEVLFVSNFDAAANCLFDLNGNKYLDFVLNKTKLPSSVKHFDKIAITSGLYFASPQKERFVFGDNCGSVLLAERVADSLEPSFIQAFAHVHGQHGCYSISYSKTENQIISCGGASTVCFFQLQPENKEAPLSLLNTVKPCSSLDYTVLRFVPNRSNIATSRHREFVCGFSQKSFMVSSIQPSQLILARHYCSGRQRGWDVFVDEEKLSTKFVYIRQGLAFLLTAPLSTDESTGNSKEVELQPPLHGLRIHDCKFVCHLACSNAYVFAMVSEDATVSIVAVEDRTTNVTKCGSTVHILHRLSGHISGVRCVQVLEIEPTSERERKFILLTGGSRGIMLAWSLTLHDTGVGSLKNSAFCRKVSQIALTNEAISAFELPGSSQTGSTNDTVKANWRHHKIHGPPLAPDMRFMDVATNISTLPSENAFDISAFVACSDATVRIFQLRSDVNSSPTFNNVLCLSEGLSFCQLRVAFARLNVDHNNNCNNGIIVSADTGGYLNVWRWPEILCEEETKPTAIRLHQSGINALQVLSYENVFFDNVAGVTSFLAITGGDDTALVVSKLTLTQTNDNNNSTRVANCQELVRINSAHSSQISGLSFIKPWNIICTTSIDQRIRFWKLCAKESGDSSCQQRPTIVSSQFLAGYVSCVADASSIALATTSRRATSTRSSNGEHDSLLLFALVAGEGFQCLKATLN